jgi:deazaflavin-dependent oxidoreductase (nitroreductase family)
MPSRIGNFFIKTLLNSPLHPLLGPGFALISVTGRKSGRSISTPVNVVTIQGVRSVISLRNRKWWRNLRAGGLAQLRQGGKLFPVRSEVVETPAEVNGLMQAYFAQYPGYAKYFKIPLGKDGQPAPLQLEQVAGKHVVVRLFPV